MKTFTVTCSRSTNVFVISNGAFELTAILQIVLLRSLSAAIRPNFQDVVRIQVKFDNGLLFPRITTYCKTRLIFSARSYRLVIRCPEIHYIPKLTV